MLILNDPAPRINAGSHNKESASARQADGPTNFYLIWPQQYCSTTTKCCMIILYHALENTAANTDNEAPNGKVDCNIVALHAAGVRKIWIDQSGFSRREKLDYPDVDESQRERH